MRALLTLPFVVMAMLLGPPLEAFSAPEGCERLEGHCSYYSCLSKSLRCRDEGYLKSFGQHYCAYFEKNEARYSREGKVFLSRVRLCLQKALSRESLSCDNVRAKAIDSHIPCYVESGFCELSLKDRQRIYDAVWRELRRPDFFAAAFKIQGHCQNPVPAPEN